MEARLVRMSFENRKIKIALIGAGMFGGDVHLRTYADLQRSGLAPHLGRIGLDDWARDFAPISFELAAVAASTRDFRRTRVRRFQTMPPAIGRGLISARSRGWMFCAMRRTWMSIAVATPDHLHTPVILAALQRGAHVITEKPMCLSIHEADQIVELAREKNLIVSVDMHKRYDPDHLRIRDEIKNRIGEPLYGVAYLEEPLEVSTRTFKWADAERSVQLRRPALGRFDLALLPQQTGLADGGRPKKAAGRAKASRPTTRCRCGWITPTA